MVYNMKIRFCEKVGIYIVFLRPEDEIGWELDPPFSLEDEELNDIRDSLVDTNYNVFNSLEGALDYIHYQFRYKNS